MKHLFIFPIKLDKLSIKPVVSISPEKLEDYFKFKNNNNNSILFISERIENQKKITNNMEKSKFGRDFKIVRTVI